MVLARNRDRFRAGWTEVLVDSKTRLWNTTASKSSFEVGRARHQKAIERIPIKDYSKFGDSGFVQEGLGEDINLLDIVAGRTLTATAPVEKIQAPIGDVLREHGGS